MLIKSAQEASWQGAGSSWGGLRMQNDLGILEKRAEGEEETASAVLLACFRKDTKCRRTSPHTPD